MAENRLDGFVVNPESVQVRCEPAAESVPAVPAGQGIVVPEFVALGLVFFLGLSANLAMAKSEGNHATSEVVEIQRLSVAGGDGEATKLATDYAGAKSAADNMSAFLDLAKSGNKAASVNVPPQGALEITTSQGVHRINRRAVRQRREFVRQDQRADPRGSNRQTDSRDVLADMQLLQNVIAGTAQTKYQNGLKAVNQNYGANFTPVQM